MCGVVGIYHKKDQVCADICDALIQVQHRGQDAAGIATWDQSKMYAHKELGLVTEVFKSSETLENLVGNMGIGHVRYPTAGGDDVNEAQPFYTANPVNVTLAHNGTLTNSEKLKEELIKTHFCQFNTNSDSEVLLNLFCYELNKTNFRKLTKAHVFKAIKNIFQKCSGGYAVIMLVAGIGVVAFRDPKGIRPLAIGNNNGSFMIASESSAISSLGYKLLGDIAPGQAIIIDSFGALDKKRLVRNVVHQPCIFEYVYFSRPDSTLDEISVHKSRLRMGDFLGDKILNEYKNIDVDVVIPVPDTSRTSAMQVAYKLGVKYREGFMKNRYIGRTFIMPGQNTRKKSVAQKLNPIEIEFKNKNVLLVDDSIVRGHTSKKIIQMVRKHGAKKVYFASASPPIRYQNVFGIDMPATKELVAHNRTIRQIKNYIGADELIYQDLESLRLSASIGNPKITEYEDSVFTGNYCDSYVTKDYLNNLEKRRKDVSR
jgi:amidophosphoribosyltransferase